MTVSVEQRILSIVKNKQDTNHDKLKSMIDLSAAKHTCWEVSSIQQKIPFESESFEHVFVDGDVPEFDSEHFLNEISRVLSKKGTVLFVKKTDKAS
jgi:ubiquinone/menaquinone biosynthesis C-methylase UbiE